MPSRRLAFLLALCLAGLVFGVKLEIVHRYGSDLPRWDQYDAEGLAVFVPLAEGKLGVADLLRPHNEHRIVWTKLLGLLELQLNGQWDARLQCTVNALLHSVVAAMLYLFAVRHLPGRRHPWIFLLVATFFAAPLAWENPLAGFHSQQYFLVGFSFAAIALLPFARFGSVRWWSGAACLLAALGTMGSGLFAAAIVAGVIGLQAWRSADPRAALRSAAPTLVACAIVLALGALARVSVNYHDSLKAHSIRDFILYALHCLQWPAARWPVLAAVFWLPSAWVAGLALRRRSDLGDGRFPLLLCGLAAWTLLQILATAYARGAGAGMPSSRYLDTLAFGLIVNGLALAWLWDRLPRFAARLGLALAWTLPLLVCLAGEITALFRQTLPANRYHLEACEENVRRYLMTNAASDLPEDNIPYPGIRALRERIDLPAIRAILPVSVRAPVTLAPASQATPFILRDTIRRAGKFAPPPAEAPAAVAGLPDLVARRVWISDPARGPGSWQSQPFTLDRDAVLRFLVAGQAGAVLSLARTVGDNAVFDLPLQRASPRAWRSLHVSVPRGTYVLTAQLADPAQWLAFAEPTEMAPGSFWFSQLTRRGRAVWVVSLLLTLAVGAGAMVCARRGKPIS